MATARWNGAAAGGLGSLFSLGAAGGLSDGQLVDRFLARDDPAASEAAFTALLDRHGSMVLGVCRRELGDEDEAHDAFQATFLVLASKARTIRRRESVGGWLLGIARRVSARARVEGARRRRLLQEFAAVCPPDESAAVCPAAMVADTLDHAILLAEVDRLPERFRGPVVLHYFEGLSAEAAAQRLGCARGTVLSRLARARVRIKRRLEQQGVSYPALLPAAVSATRWLTLGPVPAGLALSTARAVGSLGLAGAAVEGVVPAAAARLSRDVARRLFVARAGMTAALLVAAIAGVSIGLAATARLGPRDEPRAGRAMERKPAAGTEGLAPHSNRSAKADPVTLRGQVLDPDGKPAAGAVVWMEVRADGPARPRADHKVAASGRDGRFECKVSRSDLEPLLGTTFKAVLAAGAPGSGPDWVGIDPAKLGEPFTFRLRRDDVPIEGRLVSLEGRPLVGVSVKISSLVEVTPEVPAQMRENGNRMQPQQWGQLRNSLNVDQDGAFKPVRTGPDGRFRLTGIGRDRLVGLNIEGGPVEWTSVLAFTASDPGYQPILLPGGTGKPQIEGPRFERAVAPGRSVEGTVRDRDTRRPIAGARVHNSRGKMQTSDAQGGFRFEGMPASGGVHLTVIVEKEPYVTGSASFDEPRPLVKVRADMTVKRGVWIEGRVTDRVTGRGVQAIVGYYPLIDNPHLKDYPDASFHARVIPHQPEFATDPEGRFRAAVPPGGAVLTVKANGGYKAAPPIDVNVVGMFVNPGGMMNQAYVPIDVPTDRPAVIPPIALEPSRSQHLAFTDPEGHPVAGTRLYWLRSGYSNDEPLAGADLVFHHEQPGDLETVMIVHEGRSLGAAVDLKGDEPDPMRVSLKSTGTVAGRLLDDDGRPRAGASIRVTSHIRHLGRPIQIDRREAITTGADGRFRITHIVPGVNSSVQVVKHDEQGGFLRPAEGYLHAPEWTVKPGETQDWGDVRVRGY